MSLIAVLVLGVAFAESDICNPNHLLPERGLYSFMAPKIEDVRLSAVLLSQFDKRPVVRLVASPSFEPEWALSIEPKDRDKAVVKYNELSQNYYQSENRDEVVVRHDEGVISAATASLLKEVWQGMLLGTRFQTPSQEGKACLKADGTKYHFHCKGPGAFLDGYAHSPSPSSAPGRLVEIGTLLQELVKRPDARQNIEDKIDAKAKELLKELKETPNQAL